MPRVVLRPVQAIVGWQLRYRVEPHIKLFRRVTNSKGQLKVRRHRDKDTVAGNDGRCWKGRAAGLLGFQRDPELDVVI